MSYAPARVRSRAPWTAFLLVPLLALATVLAPGSVANAATGVVTAEVTAASEASGLTVHVTGTGLDGITGVYAAIIEKGTEASVGTGGGYAAFGYWMPPGAGITGGAFDRTLTVPTANLDRDTQYEFLIWQGHSAPDATTIYARTDVAVSAAQWDAIFPPPAPVPTITTEVTAASAASGLTVRVVGSDFGAVTGAYAAVIVKGTEESVSAGGGYAGFGYWMTPGAITGGAFDKTIPVPTAALDRNAQYEVIVWQGHTAPDATTMYARADVTITSTQWNTVLPPTYGITVDSSGVAGGTVQVTGVLPASYVATDGSTQTTGVYLMYCAQPAGEPGSGASGRAGGTGNCNSASQKWVIQPGVAATPGTTQIGTVDGGVWTFTTTVTVPNGFGTKTCLDAATAASGAVQCGIALRLDHNSGAGANATYTYDRFVPVDVPAPAYGITVDQANIADGTVEVTGKFPTSYVATDGSTQTTGVYLMYCVQPAGEPGSGATGRAGGTGNCNSPAQKWVVQPGITATPGTTQIGTVSGGVWTFTTTVAVAETFGTKACLDATTAGDGGVQCGIAVRLDHNSGAGASATYTYDRFVPVTFAAPEPEPVPTITAQATAATAADGLTVRVVGSGFDGITGVYAALIEKGTESSVGTSSGYAAFGYWMPPAAGITGGAFDRTLVAPASALDAAKQYEVIVWQGHSAPNESTLYDRADVTVSDEQWAAIFPEVPTITAGVTAASKADGLTVNVIGTRFGSISTAYAAVIEKGTESQVTASGGYAGFGFWATPGSITGGAFDKDIVAATAKLDKTKQYEVIVWQAHSTPTASTIYARADVSVTAAQWALLFPAPSGPGTTPTTPTTPSLGAGSLVWGVKASFRSYVTGPIAGGAITTSGTGTSIAGYVFPQAGAASISGGLGTVAYSGSVRFSGHGGALDLRLSDPQVRIESATSGTLLVRVNGGERIGFAALALGSGSTLTDGSVKYTNAAATLTPAGADAFESFYGAGTALDPVTFTIGAAGAPLGGTIVRASASNVTPANTPDATPPATDGITVTGDAVEGGTITAEADGFQPGETDILAVIYSTPTVLAEGLTADANGRVSWTGVLPRGLTGEHTLTFQGSVDRGIVLDIQSAAELQCTVSDASLVWGFKESFRAYIDGSIANGEWTAEGGASYETPVFTWAGGTGGADLEAGDLDLQFPGSVRFTGHDGALDTTVANPRLVVDGDSAVLLLDVTGTTQAGDPVQATAVEFAELDLSGVEAAREGDTVTWADVPATLSAAGADAFGTYPQGEALDPLTIVATVDSACGSAATPTPEATDDTVEPQPTADGWPLWATILIVVLVLLAIAALVVFLVRRRKA